MKISVAMATYNGEKYITEQLDTIRNQTRKIDELIICDDRSTDNTVSVVNDYIQKYGLEDRWSIQVNEENLGYANNFNKVTLLPTLNLSSGKEVDDIIFSSPLSPLVLIIVPITTFSIFSLLIKIISIEIIPFMFIKKPIESLFINQRL